MDRKALNATLEAAASADAGVGERPAFYLKKMARIHKEGYRYITKKDYERLRLKFVDELPVHDGKGWYCTFDKYGAAAKAKDALQLPDTPKYRIEFEIKTVKDHMRIPYAKGEKLDYLEILCRDCPEYGGGGGSQFLVGGQKIKIKAIWDVSGPKPVRVK